MTSESQGKPQESQGKPSGSKTTEPSTSPKTHTQEQVDKLVAGVQSPLDKEIAGLKRTIESNKTSNTALNTRLKDAEDTSAQLRKTAEEVEFNAIDRTNPDALSLFTAKQAHRDTVRAFEANVAEFEQKQAQFESDIAEVKGLKILQSANEIVSRDEFKGVPANSLVELTDGSPDKMEALAKVLALSLGNEPPPKPPENPPDPGSNLGGVAQLTPEQMENMTTEEYAKHPSNVARFKD